LEKIREKQKGAGHAAQGLMFEPSIQHSVEHENHTNASQQSRGAVLKKNGLVTTSRLFHVVIFNV